MKPLYAGGLYFALVFGAGFLFALVRIPLMVPVLGQRLAELIEMPFMLVVILLAAQHVVTRFALPQAAAPRLTAGFVALVLLLGGEVLLLVVRQQPVAEYFATRDPVSGGVYLVLLLAFALMPLVIEKLRPPPRRPSA